MKTPKNSHSKTRVALVVPHIFMQDRILPDVIFSPGDIAIDLANGLAEQDIAVTLFTPGKVSVGVPNITADLSFFEAELALRGDTYLELLKKHPLTFITLSRQVQSELISNAYSMANNGEFDVVHIFTNEEDTALPFASLCTKPVVFTHHDPFNFLVNYRSIFPKYSGLNWISISDSQRSNMPKNTNWLGTVHHGIPEDKFTPKIKNKGEYIAYLGRIIEPKGVHLAIDSVYRHNELFPDKPVKLLIAGKHYSSKSKNTYWEEHILPKVDDVTIKYVGYLKTALERKDFLSNALGLLVPSIFDEPFGMVNIEALACGTPIIGLNSGAIPEIIEDGRNGILVNKAYLINSDDLDITKTSQLLANAISKIKDIDRESCRKSYEKSYTSKSMCNGYAAIYKSLQNN